MKLLVAALCVVSSVAQAPPRIELDLAAQDYPDWAVHYHPTSPSALDGTAPHNHMYSSTRNETLIDPQHPLPSATNSRHDWSARCPAGASTTIETCPFPIAKAWDSQDKDISTRIVTRVFLLNKENKDCSDTSYNAHCGCSKRENDNCLVTEVLFGSRARYLFLYDVADNAGNKAEQVVYMLELDDTTPPVIKVCNSNAQPTALVWEATNGGEMCRDTTISDNIDLSSNMTLYYRILRSNDQAATWTVPTGCSGGEDIYRIANDGKYALTDCNGGKCSNWHKYNDYINPPAGTTPCATAALENDHGMTTDGKPKAVGLGDFMIYYLVCDNAGAFARYSGGQISNGWHDNNCVMKEQALKIKDDSKPSIQIQGDNQRKKQCYKVGELQPHATDLDVGKPNYDANPSVDYNDNVEDNVAAKVTDRLDTDTLNLTAIENQLKPGGSGSVTFTDGSHAAIAKINVSKLGLQYVVYNAGDLKHGATGDTALPADQQTRTVNVVDEISPTINLNSPTAFNGGGKDVLFIADDCGSADHLKTENRSLCGSTNLSNPCPETKISHPYQCDMAPHNQKTTALVYADIEPGWNCTDECTVEPTKHAVEWGSPLTLDVVGTYTATYKCTDESDNEHKVYREFRVEDKGKPIITVNGPRVLTIEATLDYEYVDSGATCTDTIDGNLNLETPVGGDPVALNEQGPETLPDLAAKHGLSKGHYVLTYDCVDQSGNQAVTQYRTVVVVDTTCPAITLKGEQEVHLEAGFAYMDSGATAQDNLNGDITGDIVKSGDTVKADQSMHWSSCHEIAQHHEGADSGPYYIVRNVKRGDVEHLERVLVECYISGRVGYTYKKISGGLSTVPYEGDDGKCDGGNPNCQGDCPAFGLNMMEWDGLAEVKTVLKDETGDYISEGTNTTKYLCGVLDELNQTSISLLVNTTRSTGLLDVSHGNGKASAAAAENAPNAMANSADWKGMAHQGVYVITYRVQDTAGNWNDGCGALCNEEASIDNGMCCGRGATGFAGTNPMCGNNGTRIKRTVTVLDTLPPVITLHLKRNNEWTRLQTSKGDQKGINGINVNPAGGAQNPFINTPGKHPKYGGNTDTNRHFGTHWSGYSSFNLMAQAGASVNAWMLGAIASGVVGVALLAASFRRAPVTVEV